MNTTEPYAVYAIAATVVVSLAYYFFLEVLSGRQNRSAKPDHASLFILRKTAGFLLLGFVPAVNAWFLFREGPLQAGLVMAEDAVTWLWVLLAGFFFIALNLFNSRDAGLRENYPEMRLKQWTLPMLALSAAGWFVYLLAYEYLFRGILLFACYGAFGLWPAVTINLALYAALHLPKGLKEAVVTIPFGLLICWLTLESGSILPAVVLHFLQAFSCEVSCILRNPEMKIQLKKN